MARAAQPRRASLESANPLGAGFARPEAVIEQIEALYRGQGQPAIFRVPSFVAAIDEPLAARGYRSEGETCVLHGAMDGVTAAADPAVELSPQPGNEWLSAMAMLQGHTDAQRRGMAEADPSSDVDGWDAAYKLVILSWLGFGVHVVRDDVRRTIGVVADGGRA